MTTENLVALLTLTALEIVLGIDNVIFIAILSGKLPDKAQQDKARKLGIGLAVVSRIVLLLGISFVMKLTEPLLTIPFLDHSFSGRDLILLIGGLFLIGKSTYEIHEKLEGLTHQEGTEKPIVSLASVLFQIMLVDVIFSLDSVITAVGISGVLWVMIPAVLVSSGIMLFFSGSISRYVEKHPTMKILALSFLILIGSLLVIEGWAPEAAHDLHLKNYAYFAMAFSFIVELVNIQFRKPAANPVQLHNKRIPTGGVDGAAAAASGSARRATAAGDKKLDSSTSEQSNRPKPNVKKKK